VERLIGAVGLVKRKKDRTAILAAFPSHPRPNRALCCRMSFRNLLTVIVLVLVSGVFV
jgi:hypothetical protein